ncbi:MAG: AsmA family protein, partial [Nitrosopumilus sp.]
IIETTKSEANKTLKAELDFDNDITINIFKSFPNLNLGFKDLSLTYPDSTFRKDTFFAADKLEVSFDLMKFYKEQKYQFKSITIDRPRLHLELLNDTTVNWDIVIASEEDTSEESTALNFELDNIQIENGSLEYLDAAAKSK